MKSFDARIVHQQAVTAITVVGNDLEDALGERRELAMRLIRQFGAALLLGSICCATPAQGPAPPSNKKPKKVYTTDDLNHMSGGVSVIGSSDSWKSPDGTKDRKDAAAAPTPEAAKEKRDESCKSEGFGMAVSAALSNEGMQMGRGDAMDRMYGTTLCAPIGNVGALVRRLEGDYTLDSGRRVRVSAEVTNGLAGAAAMIDNNGKNRSYVVIWKGTAYLETRVQYVTEVIGDPMGGATQTNYITSGLDLYDPLMDREARFDIQQGNAPSEIEAMILFNVTERK